MLQAEPSTAKSSTFPSPPISILSFIIKETPVQIVTFSLVQSPK